MQIKYKKKGIVLLIISLLASEFMLFGFSNNEKPGNNNLASKTRLCCCSKIMSTCQNCREGCCSEESGAGYDYSTMNKFQESEEINKQNTIFISHDCNSDVASVSPELNYYVSLSTVIHYLPFVTSTETITLELKDPLLAPPHRPPRLQFISFHTKLI